MAHFYGTIRGHRGQASRLGTKVSGFNVVAASWQGAVDVSLYTKDGVDMALVVLKPWQGKGQYVRLYDGPVSGAPVAVAA
jgi:hypothetical protein